MVKLNAIGSFTSFIEEIKKHFTLRFRGSRNDVFDQNIKIVDSQMDKILNCAVLSSCGYYDKPDSNTTEDICAVVTKYNPVGVRNPDVFYPAKFKEFLFDAFAGLTASKPWNGRKLLTGGYIDVDKNGDMLYYRAMSDDIFSSYLYHHTYFDRPDRGVSYEMTKATCEAKLMNRVLTSDEITNILFSNPVTQKKNLKKGDWGYIYKEEQTGEYIFAINFQVRFK